MGLFKDIVLTIGLLVMSAALVIGAVGYALNLREIRDETIKWGLTWNDLIFIILALSFLVVAVRLLYRVRKVESAIDSRPNLSITCEDASEFEQIGVKEYGRIGFNPWVRNLKLLRIDNNSGVMAERCRVRIRSVTPKPTLEKLPLDLLWLSNEQPEIDIEPWGSSYIVLAEHLVRDRVHDGDMFWGTFMAQPKTEFQTTVVAFAKDSNAARESFLIKRKHPEHQLPEKDPFPSVTSLPTSHRKGFLKRAT